MCLEVIETLNYQVSSEFIVQLLQAFIHVGITGEEPGPDPDRLKLKRNDVDREAGTARGTGTGTRDVTGNEGAVPGRETERGGTVLIGTGIARENGKSFLNERKQRVSVSRNGQLFAFIPRCHKYIQNTFDSV